MTEVITIGVDLAKKVFQVHWSAPIEWSTMNVSA